MNRVIRKSRTRASEEVTRLLASLFAAELIAPSKCLWLISPWISDVPIVDNSANSFDQLRDRGSRPIRLSEVLVELAQMGTTVVVGTTNASTNASFLSRVRTSFLETGVSSRLLVDIDPRNELHEKAITGNDFVVNGSMNITFNGIFVREELIELRTDADYVATARMDAFERFGGLL